MALAVGYWGYDGGGGSGVDYVPSHAIILARSVLVPFDIAREGSKFGVGEDVGVLARNLGCVALRLLCNCPLATVHNKVYWWKTGKGDTEARNSL
jgi:hypothetical protein